MNETTKTSLLIVATVFTAAGASMISTDVVRGSILLLLAVGTLVFRGWLKQKGIIKNQ